MLEPFGDGLWLVDGPMVRVAGFGYPTRMAVIRLADGALFLWSPVALSAALLAEIEALGKIRYLIAPNSLHHLFLADWQRACPDAALHASPELRKRRKDLDFADDLDAAATIWADEIDQVAVEGNRITTETVFFHRRSRTALITDLIQHFDSRSFTGWRRLVAWLDRMTAPAPEVPRKFRFAFHDRAAARAAVRRILAWPIERVVIAHGSPVGRDGRAVVAHAFRWLVG